MLPLGMYEKAGSKQGMLRAGEVYTIIGYGPDEDGDIQVTDVQGEYHYNFKATDADLAQAMEGSTILHALLWLNGTEDMIKTVVRTNPKVGAQR